MALRLREHLACSQVLSSLPSTLQAILVLLMTLVFDIWRVGDLLWRINKMISRETHSKSAVWGTRGTLQGMLDTNSTKDGPLLTRGGWPFSCALVLASTPVGCRSSRKWSALCEELPIPPTASLCSRAYPHGQHLQPQDLAGHGQRPLHGPPLSIASCGFP